MQYDMELQWRPGTKHRFANSLSCSHSRKTRGATVDDYFPGDSTVKMTYRGPQGPMLDGVPLGQLGIWKVPLTVLAAVTFTPDLPPLNTNPVGHRHRAHSLDSVPMLPKAVVIGCAGGGGIRALDDIFEFTGVTNHDLRALECARENGMAASALFK